MVAKHVVKTREEANLSPPLLSNFAIAQDDEDVSDTALDQLELSDQDTKVDKETQNLKKSI